LIIGDIFVVDCGVEIDRLIDGQLSNTCTNAFDVFVYTFAVVSYRYRLSVIGYQFSVERCSYFLIDLI